MDAQPSNATQSKVIDARKAVRKLEILHHERRRMAFIVVGDREQLRVSVLGVKGGGLPVEGLEAGSDGTEFPRVSLAFSEQARTDSFASVRLLDEKNIHEQPIEMDFAAEPAE